jgi:phosphoglycolate phosphatase-like HAD superfamily hydrolase
VGAAPCFKGGIFGALKTFQEYSKDKVIKGILKDYNLHGSELFVVGDGPVEIRNAKSNGALAVGVASDEVAGHGLNAHKRERLIRAGADIIVADFEEGDRLARYLFAENEA